MAIATSAIFATLGSQALELEKDLQTCGKTCKWFNISMAILVSEGLTRMDHSLIEAQIMDKMLRPQKRPVTCIKCKQEACNNQRCC